jgi:hypothetical protein
MQENEQQQILKICHTLKSHFSARSMAIYLLRKKVLNSLPIQSEMDSQQDVGEILDVLETSLEKELSLVEQLEQLGKGLTEDAETEA